MNCPHCNVTLVMSEKSGIEIDYCPQCRGVWLDRGELDKIIERSTQYGGQESYRHEGHLKNDSHHHGKHKSFLRELFD